MLPNLDFNLYLIRHGQSEVNARPDEMGQSEDVKLTDKGKDQAKKLGRYFDQQGLIFDKIFSSPYERALRTARIVTNHMNEDSTSAINLAPELREYEAGQWTGGSRSKIMTDEVRHRMNIYNMDFQPPLGESLSEVENRVSSWLNKNIIYNEELHERFHTLPFHGELYTPPLNIAVFSHGMTIKCLLHHIMGFDKSFTWKISIDNTSVTKLRFNDTGWGLDYLNNTNHLGIE